MKRGVAQDAMGIRQECELDENTMAGCCIFSAYLGHPFSHIHLSGVEAGTLELHSTETV